MKYPVFDAHVDTLMRLSSPQEYLEGNSRTQLDMPRAMNGSVSHLVTAICAEAEKEPDVALEALLSRAADEKVVAIGETGLDYFYDNAPRDMQKVNFITHMDASRETQLPLIVHTRDADDDCIDLLQAAMAKGAFPGVIHCFTATERLAQAALDMGFYISISGIVTFKNAKELQTVVKDIPLNRLLVETDAPFLAPIPHRGRTCEPAYVADTARFIANLREIELNELHEETTSNFFNLFNKITPPKAWS